MAESLRHHRRYYPGAQPGGVCTCGGHTDAWRCYWCEHVNPDGHDDHCANCGQEN